MAGVVSGDAKAIDLSANDNNGNTTAKKFQVSSASGASGIINTYDANGNLVASVNGAATTSYEWDAADRLVAVEKRTDLTPGTRSEFSYDGAGRRVKIVEKNDSGTITSTKQLVWDEDRICQERNAANSVTKKYFSQGMQQGKSSYYYTFDHLGSVRELTDSTGTVRCQYDYDPFGGLTALVTDNSVSSDFRFTGHYYHWQSGLHLTWFRAYDATTARWLSRDPIQEVGGLNLFAYVANDPVNYIDLFGLKLTDSQIANIVFNETRSISGPGVDNARKNVAHAVMNGDEAEDKGKGKRPKTASDQVKKLPPVEKPTHDACKKAVDDARKERKKGIDPTKGGKHFNLRPNDSTKPFQGHPIKTHDGPLNNSFPTPELPKTGIYINTYE